MPVSSRPAWRLLSFLLCSLVASALLVGAPTAADAQPDPDEVEAEAAAWLAAAHADREVVTGGALADLIFALTGAVAELDTVPAALTDLEAVAADYVRPADAFDEGPLGKTLLAVLAAGGDGNAFAGLDLEAELRALVQEEGGDAGRVGDADVFAQSLAVMALAATEDGAPAAGTAWLASRRCPDGGWPFALETAGDGTSEPCAQGGAGHLDTTALAIQALLADPAAAEEVTGATQWLLAQQGSAGDFDANANSSGLAAQALRAMGQTDAADAAAAFIATLQKGPEHPEAGAFAFRADDDGSLLLATSQGLLAFGAPALPALQPPADAPGGACDADTSGVTVVVDLAFFDGGEVVEGCALGDPASGLDALRQAGFDVITQRSDFGEFVCAIQGRPELACDQPFEGQFWAYFSGRLDGAWEAYGVGADTSDPDPGDVEGWRYGEGEPPTIAVPGAVVERIAGAGRIATAVAASRGAFTSAGGVVLARADGFADALAGTPLAAAVDGPLLTTFRDALPDEVAGEIQRILAPSGTVHVLGGSAAIGEEVVARLEALGYTVVRVAGADRIATALAVADELAAVGGFAPGGEASGPAQVLLTTGTGFADALAAGTAAAASGDAVVLLTPGAEPHPAVDGYLADHPDAAVIAIGGPASQAYPDAEAVGGATREATAVAVAVRFFSEPTVVGLARRDDFADALAGGVHVARLGGPLLVSPTGALSQEAAAYVCGAPSVRGGVVYGGEAAIAGDTSLALAQAVTGAACG
ncbi:MAG: cell wall-binding repeat-containing protein [Actinobacteria bacterium]|nr:cell wall-binding repeat-containing protein [Actinomycetota bacterium]